MAILSNIRRVLESTRRARNKPPAAPAGFVAWPYLDSLFDYTKVVGPGSMISAPVQPGKRVAIVGAGAAGLCAAFELLKIGVIPVIYEASGRIGGRAWSQPFDSGSPFAELGSMRVPPSQKTFVTYANMFGMTPVSGGFPDPGKVQTRLYYENQAYDWAPGAPPPGIFQNIAHDFDDWIGPITDKIYAPWQQGNMSAVQQIWQSYIDQYKNVSFYQAVAEGIPQWNSECLNAFGALGLGSGGFGPLYEIGMLELLRIILQQWEDDQQLYEQGMTALCDGFYNTPVSVPGVGMRSLASYGAVQLNTPVTGIDWNPGTRRPILYFSATSAVEFDAVIVATTTRSMELMGLTMPASGGDVLAEKVRVGLRNLHMTSSSKLFIKTATKFWKGQPSTFPLNIQTDELPRGIYTLDYPQTDNGVVLISYTWEDDSVRLQGMSVAQRFQFFQQVISKISPEFAECLVPFNGQILNVDWQSEPNTLGAFKLNYPGQEPAMQQAYFQFMTCTNPSEDRGIYLAGDGVSWSGGWTEGALQTGINAATAVAYRLQGSLASYNALQQNPAMYDYGAIPGQDPCLAGAK